MSARLISPWKRANSNLYWFRMVVPPRYRQALGKTEIKQSLGTPDVGEARRLCAKLQTEWLGRFAELALKLDADAAQFAPQIVDQFLEHEAGLHGGLDAVIRYELDGLALAESSYSDPQAPIATLAAKTDFLRGDDAGEDYDDEQREIISLRRLALQSNRQTCSLPGSEAAQRALARGFWDIAGSFLHEAFNHAGVEAEATEQQFSAAAKHYLRRLLEHPLPELSGLRKALPAPLGIQPAQSSSEPPPPRAGFVDDAANEPTGTEISASERSRLFPVSCDGRRISQVFASWAATQPLEAKKLVDEWGVAIRRFLELFGDLDVAEIDPDMVIDFREAMRRLPSRPKKAIAALPLLEQVELAQQKNLRLLAGPTVAKLVSGLRVTLEYARDPLRIIRHNPAAGVKVTGGKSAVDARLAFEPHELAKIFEHLTSAECRASDTEFWLQFLAPLSGLRLEEMGKLRPSNIKCEKGIWYIDIARDSAKKRRATTAAKEANKAVKSKGGFRHVPLHWLLIEGGFLDFVDCAAAEGSEWLFQDLEPDDYGNRTKMVSRRLIRRFRTLGIDEEEKVFYSFRHSMKRACRNTHMKEEIADLLAGHAPASVGRKYGAGAALDVLHSAVNMIDYDSVDWDAVVAAAKRRLL